MHFLNQVKKGVLLLVLTLFLTGCEGIFGGPTTTTKQEVTVSRIEISQSSIPQSIAVEQLNLSTIKVIVFYSDSTFEEVPLHVSMLLETQVSQLSVAGSHTFTVNYAGKTTTFTITLVDSPLSVQLREIFDMAVTSGLVAVTYQEWLDTIRGTDGVGIQSATINTSGNLIITLTNSTQIDVGKVVGSNGRSAEFQVSATHIQWRLTGDTTWSNLIALDLLKGAAGSAGMDGKVTEFQVSASHIQWRYLGETTWTNLIALDQFKGAPGATGAAGVDGISVVSASINQQGHLILTMSNQQTIDAGLVVSPAGTDGKQVEFQLSETHLQWRYIGDTTWINLIALDSLKGATGSAGASGSDGREVEFQVGTTHIQWRLVGDLTWKNLIALNQLQGTSGESAYDIAIRNGFIGSEQEWLAQLATSSSAFTQYKVHFPGFPADATEMDWYRDWAMGYLPVLVSLFADGGQLPSGSTTNFYVVKGEQIVLPIPTKSGFDFGGWFTDEALTKPFNSMTDYKLGLQTLVLHAKWTSSGVETYTIVFYSDGSAYFTLSNKTSGTAIDLPPAPTKTGYLFKGWASVSGGITPVEFPQVVSGNQNYYAIWEQESVIVLENHFFLRVKSQTQAQLIIEVVLGGIADVNGYDLRLNFQSSKITYASHVNGKPNILNASNPGYILFNYSDIFNAITSETVLVTITFQIIGSGTTQLDLIVTSAGKVTPSYDVITVQTNATGLTVSLD